MMTRNAFDGKRQRVIATAVLTFLGAEGCNALLGNESGAVGDDAPAADAGANDAGWSRDAAGGVTGSESGATTTTGPSTTSGGSGGDAGSGTGSGAGGASRGGPTRSGGTPVRRVDAVPR